MSLEIVRSVNAEHPALLRTNLGSTCYQHTVFVLEKLTAAGHLAYHVCKSPGEAQYTPPGFARRTVKGLDGKDYICSGVSPDAIWCDGKIVDTIAQCNDSETPIGMPGIPVWNEVPPEHWRPNNPPLTADVPAPVPVPPPTPTYPPYPQPESQVDGAGAALFADFAEAHHAPDPQMFRFAFRVAYSWLTKEVPDLEASVAKHRAEWRRLLGLPS